MDFTPLVSPAARRPKSAFFGPAANLNMIRDNFTIQTWLSIGAVLQGAAFLLLGRIALLPALGYIVVQSLDAGTMAAGWRHNRYLDDIVMKKTSAQLPNANGQYGSKPANNDIVVFTIGTRVNHPLGLLAPGLKEYGGLMPTMMKDLEEHAEEFGFLGATAWLNSSQRSTNSEIMEMCYFRTVEGLHAFAHSEYHRAAWAWWNKNHKKNPHLSIFHETYHVPKGHWETIYINSHVSHLATATVKGKDEKIGEVQWLSPLVDASKGLLKTSAGRMARSFAADEHDNYEEPGY